MIDVNFDFQAEAVGKNGQERDSDKYSPTLQEYHRILWSKPLPSGEEFTLTKISDNRLYHASELGEFYLSSDRAVPTFSRRKSISYITEQIPTDTIRHFVTLANTIGGIVVWPSVKIDGGLTINSARGFHRKIGDRLDLTIECIRRYYLGEDSPLFETLKRYNVFFDLFESFRAYIDFFLLQDYVSEDYSSVIIAPPFDNFQSSPVPKTLEEYQAYMNVTKQLLHARNKRIAEYTDA